MSLLKYEKLFFGLLYFDIYLYGGVIFMSLYFASVGHYG